MDIKQIAAAMPKAKNWYRGMKIDCIDSNNCEFNIIYAVDEAIEAQCRHLAEQGWRLVPSVEEIDKEFPTMGPGMVFKIHRWLLERE